MNVYQRANRWLVPIELNERGDVDGLYFWGTKDDEWQKPLPGDAYEFKIDVFYCKDLAVASQLLKLGYAEVVSIDPIENSVKLHMKREY